MDDYGMHDLRALATVVQDRSEAAVREAIGALPDGIYLPSEQNHNPLGEMLTYPPEDHRPGWIPDLGGQHPIELMESQAPVLVVEKARIADSAERETGAVGSACARTYKL